jgi:predicted outer membrane repeat protein
LVKSSADDVNLAGTLRWAVANAQDGDSIDILPQHITLTQGELLLNHKVVINSVDSSTYATIDGNNSSRVFEVAPGTTVYFHNLIIVGGNAKAQTTSNSNLDGDGGGILNEGKLFLYHCSVLNNGFNGDRSTNREVLKGGGIYNLRGFLFVYGGIVDENFAEVGGGGIYNDAGVLSMAFTNANFNSTYGIGGAIANFDGSNVLLQTCFLNQNTADLGGALYNQDGGKTWVNQCTLINNQANSGGGMYNKGGHLIVSNSSSLSLNTAKHDGGGIYSLGGELDVNNSTLDRNSAVGGVGGGIYDSSSKVEVELSHLDSNSALAGGGVYNYQGNLRVDLSDLVSNSTSFFGGGIANFEGMVWVSGSKLITNSAPVGAGIFNSLGTLKVGTTLFQQNTPDNILGPWIDLGGNTFI